MGLLDLLSDLAKNNRGSTLNGIISYGKNKKDGSHDHRYNIGSDRTPAQQAGDAKKKKK